MLGSKISDIAKCLLENGFQFFVVGGAVRDILQGKTPKDIDIATNANPDTIEELFERDHKVKTVGKSFGVVLVDGIEVATFRNDAYNGLSDKDVKITFKQNIIDDLSRRDFTINAMALELNGNIVDPFNGKEDLENRIIRFVENPYNRIFEDPNRIIRACRFLAKISGTFEEKTKKALKEFSKFIPTQVAPERIRLEILKAMESDNASSFFISLNEIDALQYVFPSLNACINHSHGIHIEDVFTHSMLCGDAIRSKHKPLLKLAGYLHDCGKPVSYKLDENGKESFIGHTKTGSKLAERELTELKFSNEEINYITTLIRFHMRLHVIETSKAMRRLIKLLDEAKVPIKDLMRLKLADTKANLIKGRMNMLEVKKLISKVKQELNRKEFEHPLANLQISGYDVMRLCNIKPGPEVGIVLDFLKMIILENPELNQKDILEKIVKKFY